MQSYSTKSQNPDAQTDPVDNQATPRHEQRGKSTSKASTGRDKCGYCNRAQYEDAAWFCHSHNLIDLKTRFGRHGVPGYTKVVWDVLAKAHENGDEEWGSSLSRELAEAGAVGNFEEDDYLKVVDDFNPEKSGGGLLPFLAWNNGWEKPGLDEDGKQESAERYFWNADEKVLSPYFSAKGYDENPPNVRVDKHGNTWVRLQDIADDRPDGFIKIFWDARAGKWQKYNQCQTGGRAWAGFDIQGYNPNTFESYLLRQPPGVSKHREPYRTLRLHVVEGMASAAAVGWSYKAEGKGQPFDDRTYAVLAVGSCNNLDSVVEGVLAVRPDIEVVLIPDREPIGAGIAHVAELCRKYRNIKVADPRWVSDLAKVDIDDIRASGGAGAVVSLIEQARTLTDAELKEVLGSGAERRVASGHRDADGDTDDAV
ncbi:MAG: hypothetical protein ACK443_11245, partial [Methylococcaceae bacterium]